MSKKVVITGGAGFIGSQLGYKLYKEGYEVTLIDDMSFGYAENLKINGESFGNFTKSDIRSQSIGPLLHNVDCVFHLAAISALPVCQSKPGEAISINVSGTANMLELARRAGVRRFVFASTSAIYENNTNFPCKEDDAVAPSLIYSISKLNGEALCKSFGDLYGMEIAITRYYNVYGPNQDIKRKSPPFVGYVIRELLAERAPLLHSNGKQKRDYVYIDDVNQLNILCMNHPKAAGEIFNVASGQAYSVNQIYKIIASQLTSSIQPTFRESTLFWDKYPTLFNGKFPLDGERISKEVDKFTLGSTLKTKSLLGWMTNVTIEKGLANTIEFANRA